MERIGIFNMSERIVNLEFNYAVINLQTGECIGCLTFSYEIDNEAYIPAPHAYSSYRHKFYDRETEAWFYDAEFTQPFDPEA
jgi:hypothetical protein